MNNITYYKATQKDIPTLVENRLLFVIELAGDQDETTVKSLREQLTAFFKNLYHEK